MKQGPGRGGQTVSLSHDEFATLELASKPAGTLRGYRALTHGAPASEVQRAAVARLLELGLVSASDEGDLASVHATDLGRQWFTAWDHE